MVRAISHLENSKIFEAVIACIWLVDSANASRSQLLPHALTSELIYGLSAQRFSFHNTARLELCKTAD